MADDPYFFGYGSLVNRATHDFANPHPARLSGWQRTWAHTDLRPAAFLTVVPATDISIEGLIAQVPGANWEALDQREWAYDRIPASHQVAHALGGTPDIAVYAVPLARHSERDKSHPIFLSYLDVVVQGYLREFGKDGVARFFETTAGWDVPICNDRAQPRYARHQPLTGEEHALTDSHLRALGVTPFEQR